jgi:hypothetical protein
MRNGEQTCLQDRGLVSAAVALIHWNVVGDLDLEQKRG